MTERTLRRWMGVAAAALVAASVLVAQAQQQSPRQLFERARVLEENSRTLNQAVDLYQQVVKQAKTDRVLAASAQLRIGIVQERQGKPEARTVFANIVRDYKDQPAIVTTARARLSAAPAAAQLEVTPRRVFDGVYEQLLDMSADGRFTVGTEPEGCCSVSTNGVILRESQSGRITRLAAGGDPRISRDGTRVYFRCVEGTRESVCMIGTASGAVRERVLELPEGTEFLPADWHPDGKSIVGFMRRTMAVDPSGRLELVRLMLDTKTFKQVKTFEPWQASPVLGASRVSPDGRFIAFTMPPRASVPATLYTIGIDGQNEGPVFATAASAYSPVWTPDSGSLVFRGEVGGIPGLWSVPMRDGRATGAPTRLQRDFDGFRPLVITDAGALYYSRNLGSLNYEYITNRTPEPGGRALIFPGLYSAWSPSGRQLAFQRSAARQDLIVRNMETGVETVYPWSGLRRDNEILWLPDESGVLFYAMEGDPDHPNRGIYRLDLATQKVARRFDMQANGHWRMTFGGISPDGKSLYVGVSGSENEGAVNGIARIDMATGEEFPVASFAPGDPEENSWTGIELSPDGTRFAVAQVFKPDTARLFTIGVDGNGYREVVPSFSTPWVGRHLRWTPDGQQLLTAVFDSEKNWRIMRVPATGGPLVFDGLDYKTLVPMVSDVRLREGNFNGFAISPDGTRISASTWTRAKWDLWTIDGLSGVINSR